jgi:hypothetical protein
MVDTIRDREDLESIFADGQLRGVTAQKVRDFIASLGVGGELFADAIDPVPVTTNWARITQMTGVRRSYGITPTLAQGLFTVDVGGKGIYTVDAVFLVKSTVPGWVEIGVAKGVTAPFTKMRREFVGGDTKLFVISSGNSFDVGETMGVAIQASGNAPTQMSILDSSFRVLRG